MPCANARHNRRMQSGEAAYHGSNVVRVVGWTLTALSSLQDLLRDFNDQQMVPRSCRPGINTREGSRRLLF